MKSLLSSPDNKLFASLPIKWDSKKGIFLIIVFWIYMFNSFKSLMKTLYTYKVSAYNPDRMFTDRVIF